jgi:amino acid transporter
MVSAGNIVVAVVALITFPMFFCLPFLIVKLRADEAKLDPRELPAVKKSLWIRGILCLVITVTLIVVSRDVFGLLVVLVFPLPMAAYCFGKLIMLRKFERKIRQPKSRPAPPNN